MGAVGIRKTYNAKLHGKNGGGDERKEQLRNNGREPHSQTTHIKG